MWRQKINANINFVQRQAINLNITIQYIQPAMIPSTTFGALSNSVISVLNSLFIVWTLFLLFEQKYISWYKVIIFSNLHIILLLYTHLQKQKYCVISYWVSRNPILPTTEWRGLWKKLFRRNRPWYWLLMIGVRIYLLRSNRLRILKKKEVQVFSFEYYVWTKINIIFSAIYSILYLLFCTKNAIETNIDF